MATPPPNISLQRAFAYAPKPFAALSFLSSIFVFYYLLIRHPEKRKRMYHRLILAIFVCTLLKSVGYFWGTWAIPVGTPNVVGASGTSATCAAEGVFLTLGWAMPLYCASLSIYALIAVKNNFKQEKYVWIEKWIHAGAAIFPISFAIYGVASNSFHPGHAFCRLASVDKNDECSDSENPYCISSSTLLHIPLLWVILVSILVSTLTILYLWCSFDKIQKDADVAVGMKKITESFRKNRLKEVTIQTGLYLFATWIGYFFIVVWTMNYFITRNENYSLQIVSHCFSAVQGFIIMIIYLSLQLKPNRGIHPFQTQHRPGLDNRTVKNIRRSAAKPRPPPIPGRFSFSIFDGVPAEDSPWAMYLEEVPDELIASTFSNEAEAFYDSQIYRDSVLSNPLLRESNGLEWEPNVTAV